ncbi:MAG: HAMP domain-containing protein [Cyanobacteria bacterium SIG26]|nr:HAMP domain-containing protein [Cyanobacteria bacterium SIG26]
MTEEHKVSFTTQNRLIIFGLILSTLLIMAIAVFASVNIQKNLNQSYQDFGQIISKILAIESVELTKDAQASETLSILKTHSNSILKSNKDVVFIEFRNANGDLIYKTKNNTDETSQIPNISVSSPMVNLSDNSSIGSVTVGLSGSLVDRVSSTTRASILFVFVIVWLVFAFVILINTYLITRELRILRNGVQKISSGEFGYTIEGEDVSDEVQELFNSFNQMSARLNIYEEQNIEQLTLERNKLEAVLMSIANGVVVCDNNDNVVLINNHAKELLELDADELLNTNIQEYVDTEGEYCFNDKIEEYKNLSMEEKSTKPIVFNVTIGGRILKSIISPMFTRNHDYLGYIIVLIDVTREIEMDQMKSHFISNVSHELRTPVTVLRSYIDTLYNYGDEFDAETKKEFISTLNTEIIRLNGMVNDILDFSRLDSNAKIEKSENDICQLVDSCVSQVGVLLKEHNLKIEVEKENDIPLLIINYDAISRALTNYLSNAIKYAPHDSTIKVRLYKELEDNLVTVTVRDEGIGIAPEFQKKVFERFYRVENKTHSVKGTGLGLHLVKTTIEKHHHGHVFVASQVNCGSTFGFSLPIDLAKVDAVKCDELV